MIDRRFTVGGGPTSRVAPPAPRLADLLERESAAAESYRTAINLLEQEQSSGRAHHHDRISALRRIRDDHVENLDVLPEHLGHAELEGDRHGASGGPSFAGTSGTAGVLRVLKEREAQMLRHYRREMDQAEKEIQRLLWERLIPRTERHIDLLDDLLADWSPWQV